MSDFSSPEDRRSPLYLDHIHGFRIEGEPEDGLLTIAGIEAFAADANPIALRQALQGWHDEVSELSDYYFLNNLAIPNLPVGFFGDRSQEPTVLKAELEVRPPDLLADNLEYYHRDNNSIKIGIMPVVGRLAYVSFIRESSLGNDIVDWFVANRSGCSFSLFGGLLETTVAFSSPTEKISSDI